MPTCIIHCLQGGSMILSFSWTLVCLCSHPCGSREVRNDCNSSHAFVHSASIHYSILHTCV
jgi:hypothetical protein